MASIRDLKKSISQLSYDDALKIVLSRRESRRVKKVSVKAKSSKSNTKSSRVIDPFAMISKMTDAQKAELRKELLGE